ncbi:MAG TPA: triphosphoribosyl-dephospho-CoA synthase [Gemmataceae bacterium]|nr:triphosphoribosyl-dephospho-CoA synthase [Gemmataceae bacterium]
MWLDGLYAEVACIWEATARKPGNVHRYRDFSDSSYVDFLLSAVAVGRVMAVADQHAVGATVFEGVDVTKHVTSTNTNLGILLLLAPLAKARWPRSRDEPSLRENLACVLNELDVRDAESVYAAIRWVNPAGLGQVAEQDVHEKPTQTLRQVMALAADRDLIARQYANGFREVFDEGVPALAQGLAESSSLEDAIIRCQLEFMANHPDSLIARKRGLAEAEEASRRARAVLAGEATLGELDAWLREEGHGRNPGTTADLVATSLFVALREGIITLPRNFTSPKRGSGSGHD